MNGYEKSLEDLNRENLQTSDSENVENEDDDRADSGLTSDGTIQEDENQSNGNPEDDKQTEDKCLDANTPNGGQLSAAYKILVKFNRGVTRYGKGVTVTVERDGPEKPFLGGYRNKVTGCEYHHASVQTNHAQLTAAKRYKISREVQTKLNVSRGQQTGVHKSSQVAIGLNGLYISQTNDKILEAKRYVTTEELLANLTRKITIIQKHWRGYLSRKRAKTLRAESIRAIQSSQKPSLCVSNLRKKDLEDFQHRIQKWRQERMAWIFKTKSGQERLSALQAIIQQEAQLLATLNHRKMMPNGEESLSENSTRKVGLMISPAQTWSGQSDKSVHRVTPAILRIRKYRAIYHRLRITQAANSVRLKVLQELQEAIQNQECDITNEIVDLAQQESVLIARDTPTHSLEPIRQRILLLFLQFIFDPKFHVKTSTSTTESRGKTAPPLPRNVSYCGGCGHYRPATDFVRSAGEKTLGLCWSCRRICKFPIVNKDPGVFKHLMKGLRKSEEQHGCFDGPAFVIGENDIRYLVQNIWQQRSVLSGVDDPYNLSLCRWKPEQPWSPWNCILLAEQESKAHHRLETPEDVYGPIFTQKVKHKHMMARRYFLQFKKNGNFVEKEGHQPVSTSIYITVKPAALHAAQ